MTKALSVPVAGRISDTRVRWVPAVTMLGTMLSVEHDMAARPVHDRTRVRDTRTNAWRRSEWLPMLRREEITLVRERGSTCAKSRTDVASKQE